jgi:hypothetical protein
MSRRFRASAGLFLTAFFAAASSFHHHPLPKPATEHTGFRSASSVAGALELCAVCSVAHTSAHLATDAVRGFAIDTTSQLVVVATYVPSSAGGSLLRDPRAPPAV